MLTAALNKEGREISEKLPLLLLDVDGPLNAYGMDPGRLPEDCIACPVAPSWIATLPKKPGASTKPFRVFLRPSHGPSLRALRFELCWATAWMDEANQWISNALELPSLPFVDFGDNLFVPDPGGLHWKTRALLKHVQGRPFAWVDDELGEADRAYVAAHHNAPALLHYVDPRVGLAEDDFSTLAAWAASVR